MGKLIETGRIFDVVIVGGGPAGLSAAIWCADLGLEAILVEGKPELGGNLLNIFNPIDNYPGLRVSNGREMQEHFEAHARRSDVLMRVSAEAVRIDPQAKTVSLGNGETLAARNIVVATGLRRRRAGVPGETEFFGRGILDSGSKSPADAAGQRVAIIGGGDAAMENAVILSKHAKLVYLIHRRTYCTARPEFVDAVRNAANIELLLNRQVKAVIGFDAVEAVDIEHVESHIRERIAVRYVLFRIGVEPNSDLVRGAVETDRSGYIVADKYGATSIEGIFAIGDVANPVAPTIISAAGQGATVAKMIRSRHV